MFAPARKTGEKHPKIADSQPRPKPAKRYFSRRRQENLLRLKFFVCIPYQANP